MTEIGYVAAVWSHVETEILIKRLRQFVIFRRHECFNFNWFEIVHTSFSITKPAQAGVGPTQLPVIYNISTENKP